MTAPDPFAAWRGVAPIPAPFYLRMVRKVKAWGTPDAVAEDRLATAVRGVFKIDDPVQSVYYVTTNADYHHTVVGMCAGRMNPTRDPFYFIAFPVSDLTAAGVTPRLVPEDETWCLVANRRLHHNIEVTEDRLRELCRTAFAAARPLAEVGVATLKGLFAAANADGCGVFPKTDVPCRAADCIALTAPTARPVGA